MDLVQFLKVLAKKKMILIIVPITALIATFFLTKNLPEVYKSEAQIAAGITDDNSAFMDKTQSDKESEIAQKFSNLIELMQLKKVTDAVSYKLILNDLTTDKPFRAPCSLLSDLSPEAKDAAVKIFKIRLDSLESLHSGDPKEHGLIEILKGMKYDDESLGKIVKITRLNKSDFVTIICESEKADLSAFIVNQLCDIFVKYYKQLNKDKKVAAVSFFAKLAMEKKADLDKKIALLRDYKIKNGIINLYEQTKSIDNMINNFEGNKELIVKNIPAYEAALKDINNKLSDKERAYLESNISPYNDKIVKLRDEIKDLSDKFIFTGNTDQVLKDSIGYKRYQLDELVKKAADEFVFSPNIAKQELVLKKLNYELELDISINNVKSLDATIQRFKNKFNAYTPLEGTVKAYESDVDVTTKEYLEILAKFNESSYRQFIDVSLRIVQVGAINDPEPSKKMILLIVAGMVTFVLCIVIIFVLEYIDLTLKTPKKFAKLTGLPILGCLNFLKGKKLDLKVAYSSSDAPPVLETFKQLLRTLRYEFEQTMGDKKIVLFTSTSDKEGKTFVAICLSYVLSLTDKKILLVDTNFRNNTITKSFSANKLLESYIKGTSTAEESITKSTVAGVDILGSEGGNYSPTEIAGEAALNEKIRVLEKEYDYVFLEGPSINKYSASKELMNIVDKVIAVFSASRVLRDSDFSTINYLKLCKDVFVGSILNNVELENLEQIFGDVDKKRSGLRMWMKRVITRNLSGSRNKSKSKTGAASVTITD